MLPKKQQVFLIKALSSHVEACDINHQQASCCLTGSGSGNSFPKLARGAI
jgi:hypothetical protein